MREPMRERRYQRINSAPGLGGDNETGSGLALQDSHAGTDKVILLENGQAFGRTSRCWWAVNACSVWKPRGKHKWGPGRLRKGAHSVSQPLMLSRASSDPQHRGVC